MNGVLDPQSVDGVLERDARLIGSRPREHGWASGARLRTPRLAWVG